MTISELVIGYRQVNFSKLQNTLCLRSGHYGCPMSKRIFPEFSVVLGLGKMTSQIEQVVDSCMYT